MVDSNNYQFGRRLFKGKEDNAKLKRKKMTTILITSPASKIKGGGKSIMMSHNIMLLITI